MVEVQAAFPPLGQHSPAWNYGTGAMTGDPVGPLISFDKNGQPTPDTWQLWTNFFGSNQIDRRQVPYSNTPKSVDVAHELWLGKNKYITEIIRQEVLDADTLWYREVLPYKEFDGTTITHEQIIFDRHTMVAEPELGVAPIVTHRKNRRSWDARRYGIMFMMENGFWMTPTG
jgi:hypothetical protein